MGIQANHAARLQRQLLAPNRATQSAELDVPSWRLHPLKGDLNDHWSVWVNGNWRLTFMFDDQDVVLVDYRDYH